MMRRSQAEIIAKAFEEGVTTVFEYSGMGYQLVGRDHLGGFGVLNVFETGDPDCLIAFDIADVRLENRHLVLVHESGEQIFGFIFEGGSA